MVCDDLHLIITMTIRNNSSASAQNIGPSSHHITYNNTQSNRQFVTFNLVHKSKSAVTVNLYNLNQSKNRYLSITWVILFRQWRLIGWMLAHDRDQCRCLTWSPIVGLWMRKRAEYYFFCDALHRSLTTLEKEAASHLLEIPSLGWETI